MTIIKPETFKENHKFALFPANFISDQSIYINNPKGFNCYAYAMQFTIPVDKSKGYYRPGFLSGKAPKIYTKNTVIPGFLGDCTYLGLKVEETTIDSSLIASAYKVILWYSENSFNPYHFTRQNEDGRWSEVCAWGEWPEVGSHLNEDFYTEEGFNKKVYFLSRK